MIAIHKSISPISSSKILLHPVITSPKLKNRLVVAQNDGTYLIPFEQIVYLEGDGNYTVIHLTDGNKIMASRSLKYFVAQVPSQDFVRIHRKYHVAVHQIVRINFSPNGSLSLNNGIDLVVSRIGKKRLHALLE